MEGVLAGIHPFQQLLVPDTFQFGSPELVEHAERYIFIARLVFIEGQVAVLFGEERADRGLWPG